MMSRARAYSDSFLHVLSRIPPELFSVDGIVGFLKVNEGCVVSSLLALPRVDLGEESRHVGGSGCAFLEALLVDPCLQQVWSQYRHFHHNSLLEDLRHDGPHYYRSDVFQLCQSIPFFFESGTSLPS